MADAAGEGGAGEDAGDGGWAPIPDEGFIALVGPLHLRAGDGAYAFRAEQRHANLIGVVQGGMLMSLADRALGETAMRAADGANCVTVQLDMKFVGAGRLGDWLVVRPEVVERTGSLVFMRGQVRAGDARAGGRLVATADGVWKILRRRPDRPDPPGAGPGAADAPGAI